MDYVPEVARKLARTRCALETIDCLIQNRPLPEAICFVPLPVAYKINPDLTSSQEHSPFDCDLRLAPSFSSPAVFSLKADSIVRCGLRPENLRFFVQPDEKVVNDCATWMKVMFYTADDSPNATKLRFTASEVDSPVHCVYFSVYGRPDVLQQRALIPVDDSNTRAAQILAKAFGQHPVFYDWQDVVDITYGMAPHLPSLAKCISPKDAAEVAKLRDAPCLNWSIKNDAQLAVFVQQRAAAATAGRFGILSATVESVELSSCLDAEELAIAALTDKDETTYWESDASHVPHHIRLSMKPQIVVEKLFINVNSDEECFMPRRVVVSGGPDVDDLSELMEISIDKDETGEVCVLEHAKEAYAVIQISVEECQADGIDTRVYGVRLVTGKEQSESPTPDDFRADALLKYPLLQSFSPDVLFARLRVLERFMSLLDLVLAHAVSMPSISTGIFSKALQSVRCLLPLSKVRRTIIDDFLRFSQASIYDICIPHVRINRLRAAEYREDLSNPLAVLACYDVNQTVFIQLFNALERTANTSEPVVYNVSDKVEQWWECKFEGEGVIDQGGAFRDCLCELAEELCPATSHDTHLPLPYFIRVHDQSSEDSATCDFILNPACNKLAHYEWIGKLMGACIRTKEKLVLSLSPFTWKQISGEQVTWDDFRCIDSFEVTLLDRLGKMTKDDFDAFFSSSADVARTFSCVLSSGAVVPLKPQGKDIPLTYELRLEYVALAKEARLNESQKQAEAIRRGLLEVVPEEALNLMTWQEIELAVCGSPEISIDSLQKFVHYDDCDADDENVKYLWEVLGRFTNDERSRFLRFVTGRKRLPTPLHICPAKHYDFGDDDEYLDTLPESSTCGNSLYLPKYTSANALESKLRYAIYNCLAIDTDTTPYDEDY